VAKPIGIIGCIAEYEQCDGGGRQGLRWLQVGCGGLQMGPMATALANGRHTIKRTGPPSYLQG